MAVWISGMANSLFGPQNGAYKNERASQTAVSLGYDDHVFAGTGRHPLSHKPICCIMGKCVWLLEVALTSLNHHELPLIAIDNHEELFGGLEHDFYFS